MTYPCEMLIYREHSEKSYPQPCGESATNFVIVYKLEKLEISPSAIPFCDKHFLPIDIRRKKYEAITEDEYLALKVLES